MDKVSSVRYDRRWTWRSDSTSGETSQVAVVSLKMTLFTPEDDEIPIVDLQKYPSICG